MTLLSVVNDPIGSKTKSVGCTNPVTESVSIVTPSSGTPVSGRLSPAEAGTVNTTTVASSARPTTKLRLPLASSHSTRAIALEGVTEAGTAPDRPWLGFEVYGAGRRA